MAIKKQRTSANALQDHHDANRDQTNHNKTSNALHPSIAAPSMFCDGLSRRYAIEIGMVILVSMIEPGFGTLSSPFSGSGSYKTDENSAASLDIDFHL